MWNNKSKYIYETYTLQALDILFFILLKLQITYLALYLYLCLIFN